MPSEKGIGYNFFLQLFYLFMINIAGVNPAVAGTVSFIAVFWDAVTDPIIGSMSDRCRSKSGGAEHRLSNTALYSRNLLALMFINIDLPAGAKVVYYILINIAYWTFLTSAVIPHIALGSELTDDFEERTTLRTCANFPDEYRHAYRNQRLTHNCTIFYKNIWQRKSRMDGDRSTVRSDNRFRV